MTTSTGKGWIVPKGSIDDGERPREAAIREAEEEAGLLGVVPVRPLGRYRHANSNGLYEVDVYLMRVTSVLEHWLEDRLRRRARQDTTELDETLGIASPVVRDGERIDLERAIARLPERCRTVLVLHDVEGFTHEEISRQLEIAVGTSKSQLFDARRAIRQYLIPKRMEMPHA